MASKMIALRFDDPAQAEEALARLNATSDSHKVQVYDAMTFFWPEDEDRPRTRRSVNKTITDKSKETLVYLAFGLLNILITLGSATLFAVRYFLRTGISFDFVTDLSSQITAGTSVLMLLIDEKEIELDDVLADLSPVEIGSSAFTQEE